jgi:two-component system OmpR family response regulator
MRVLVVDDNPDIVTTMVALLRTQGHETKECYHGSEVLPAVREFDPDVVLLDLGLPGESGWELARQIRELGKRGDEQNASSRPMLIAITGEYTNGADKRRAEMAGFDCYLLKPADPNVLLAVLAKARE